MVFEMAACEISTAVPTAMNNIIATIGSSFGTAQLAAFSYLSAVATGCRMEADEGRFIRWSGHVLRDDLCS